MIRTDSPTGDFVPRPRLGRRRLLASLLVLVLLAAACSGNETVEAGSNGDEGEGPVDETGDQSTDETGDQPESTDDSLSDESGDDDGSVAPGDIVSTTSDPSLISPQVTPVIEVVEVGESTIAVRFENGAEPCSLANVTVNETDTSIEVTLETGMHPNVAAMTCIAAVFVYEIQVELDAPIGTRTIETAA